MKSIVAFVFLLPLIAAYKPGVVNQCNLVNGGWGNWSKYGPCTVTCGSGGTQKRHRYCDNPIPKYGGKKCIGDTIEIKPCDNYVECPVDGGWGPWKKGNCSKKCGGGKVVYHRSCNAPEPKHCGKACDGPSQREEPCNTHYCPIDGKWSPWKCGNCSTNNPHKKCMKRCERVCTPPKYGGAPCKGNAVVLQYCNADQCLPCNECFLKAEKYAYNNAEPTFVGHACRVEKSYCEGKNGGIHSMYPAKYWFFLHCSPDGPWCKPCATRNLVYNPKCGQCETTKDGPCTGPIDGKWSPWKCGKCSTNNPHKKCMKKCERVCTPPKYGGAPCKGNAVVWQNCASNQCHHYPPNPNPCYNCFLKAEKYAYDNKKPTFVGHACKIDKSFCSGKNGGIRDMYPAKNWFFLHCSPDGPWCKPCATRNLVYNSKCGQCEATRDGKCTGPMTWRNGTDDELKIIDDLNAIGSELW